MKHLPILAILPFLPLALFAKDSYKVEVFTYSPASAQSATNFLNKMSTDELRKDILDKANWIQSATLSIPIGVKGTASKVCDESDVGVKKLRDTYGMAENAYDITKSDPDIGLTFEAELNLSEKGTDYLNAKIDFLYREFEGMIEYGPGPLASGKLSVITPVFRIDKYEGTLEAKLGEPTLLKLRTVIKEKRVEGEPLSKYAILELVFIKIEKQNP